MELFTAPLFLSLHTHCILWVSCTCLHLRNSLSTALFLYRFSALPRSALGHTAPGSDFTHLSRFCFLCLLFSLFLFLSLGIFSLLHYFFWVLCYFSLLMRFLWRVAFTWSSAVPAWDSLHCLFCILCNSLSLLSFSPAGFSLVSTLHYLLSFSLELTFCYFLEFLHWALLELDFTALPFLPAWDSLAVLLTAHGGVSLVSAHCWAACTSCLLSLLQCSTLFPARHSAFYRSPAHLLP